VERRRLSIGLGSEWRIVRARGSSRSRIDGAGPIERGRGPPAVPSPAKRERAKGEGQALARSAQPARAEGGDGRPRSALPRPAAPHPSPSPHFRGARDLRVERRRLSIGLGSEWRIVRARGSSRSRIDGTGPIERRRGPPAVPSPAKRERAKGEGPALARSAHERRAATLAHEVRCRAPRPLTLRPLPTFVGRGIWGWSGDGS